MAGRQSDATDRYRVAGVPPRRLARYAQAVGIVLVALSLPVAVGTGADLGVEAATAALRASLVSLTGVERTFHAAVLVALVGTWTLGFGLLVDGVFE